MLKNHVHLCHGIGSIRNMTHHDPDKETGKSWTFTPQDAIISAHRSYNDQMSLFILEREKTRVLDNCN